MDTRILRLDYIRGVSILMVILYHFSQNYFNYSIIEKNLLIEASIVNKSMFYTIGRFGSYGVSLFFILSGYLIHTIYYKTSLNIISFYKKRILRIYPIYFICLTLFFCVFNKYDNITIKDYFLHILLINNYSKEAFYSINPSFWSLSIEFQFYFIYPLVYIISRKYSLFVVYIISIILHTIILSNKTLYDNTLLSIPFYLHTWLIGFIISEYRLILFRFFKKHLFFINFFLIILIINAFSDLIYTLINSTILKTVLTDIFYILLFYKLLVIKLNFVPIFIKNIVKKTLFFYGAISYSLYLIHQPIIPTVKSFFSNCFDNYVLNMVFESICSIITITLLAYSIHKLIELKIKKIPFTIK
jgi:peptidoglycan/LPS O-acetylase OafA/YrhL